MDETDIKGLPVITDWSDIEAHFIKQGGDSFTLGICREVLSQYQTKPEDYATDSQKRHVAMLYAALRLHTGREETDPVDSVQVSIKPGNGISGRNKPAIKARKGASEAQAKFILSLISQIAAFNQEMETALQAIYTPEYMANLPWNGKGSVGEHINGLKKSLDILRENAVKQVNTTVIKQEMAVEGYYVYGDTFLCVKSNRAGTGQYATLWSHDSESWEFDRSQSYKLMKDAREGKFPRVTPEAAASFGELYGQCMRCGRKLTDANSIAEAMGKVCASKMGW